MRSRLINLAIVAGMILLYSCTSDEVAPLFNSFEDVVEEGGFVPAAKETFSVLDSTESGFETDTATWVCTTKTMKAEYAGGGDDGFALFNPNASVVYPGSMLQGKSLTQATPDVIAVERAGGVISIDVINGNNLAKVEVEEVSKSAISQAANEIIAASNEIIPANFQFSIQEVQSEQQLATALKVDYNSSFADHWEYTLTEAEYSLGSKLINQFQFHGVNAAATIDIGDERGLILVNKDGTEFVFVKFDFANNDYLVSGPFEFYRE